MKRVLLLALLLLTTDVFGTVVAEISGIRGVVYVTQLPTLNVRVVEIKGSTRVVQKKPGKMDYSDLKIYTYLGSSEDRALSELLNQMKRGRVIRKNISVINYVANQERARWNISSAFISGKSIDVAKDSAIYSFAVSNME